MDWERIDYDAPPMNETVALAYFGEEQHMFGAKAVGNFFQWPKMPKPLVTLVAGWGFPGQPTHFLRFPGPPVAK
jgi:hypothetical protein